MWYKVEILNILNIALILPWHDIVTNTLYNVVRFATFSGVSSPEEQLPSDGFSLYIFHRGFTP